MIIANNLVTDELVINATIPNLAIIRFDWNRKSHRWNSLFAHTLTHTVEEMYEKGHEEFCFPAFAQSSEYERFWRNLLSGKSFQDKFYTMDVSKKQYLVGSYLYACLC